MFASSQFLVAITTSFAPSSHPIPRKAATETRRRRALRPKSPPRSIWGRRCAEHYIRGRNLSQRRADLRHAKTGRYKGERAGGTVRFLDDSRLETYALATFKEPIAVIRVHTI